MSVIPVHRCKGGEFVEVMHLVRATREARHDALMRVANAIDALPYPRTFGEFKRGAIDVINAIADACDDIPPCPCDNCRDKP